MIIDRVKKLISKLQQMGCTTSLNQITNFNNSIIVRNVSNQNKQKLGDAVESDDLIALALLMEEIQAYPNSEISEPSMNWMLSHLCCRWDSDACLSYLLRHYFAENPKGYINYVNAQTAEGYTCLHLCGIWNSYKCFRVLHGFGGFSLTIKQSKLKNPYEISVQYKSSRIACVLKQYIDLNIDFISTKIQKLMADPLIPEKQFNPMEYQQGEEIQINKCIQTVESDYTSGTETQKKIYEEKARVEAELEKLLSSKLEKQLNYDLKRALILMLGNVEEYQKIQYQRKQQEKLKDQLDKEAKGIQSLIQSKEESLKHIYEIIKKIQSERLQKTISQAEQKIEQGVCQLRTQLTKKLKQKQGMLQSLKKSRSSVKSRETKQFKLQQNSEEDIKQKLKKCPENIIKLYEKAKADGFFVDKQFPAQNSSIGDSSKSKYSMYTTNTTWLRPIQIFKSEFKLFDGINPNDIKQGSLGVCYMLATLSALAINPINITKIFIFDDISLGFYVLKLYVSGKPTFFVIDDLVPCSKTTKSPLFTQPIGKQIWVLLLEKAWAKLIGNYLNAESMTPDHMMEDLSGAPGYGWWLSRQKSKSSVEIIKQIAQHSSLGHVVVVTSVGDKKIEGIVNNHAYSMLSTVEYNNRYIFKLRNPWGRFQWNGQFGQNSSLCTEEFKKKVGYDSEDDGIFFISENQLLKAFCFYSISHIKSDFLYSYSSFTSKTNQDIFFKFKIKNSGDVNIRITQPFDRIVNDKNYKYSPMIFEIGRIMESGQVTFISEGHQKTYFGAKSVHAFQNIFQHLQAGQYFIRIRMLWYDDKKYNSAVLGCYAIQSIDLELMQNLQGMQLLKKLFVSFASNSKKSRAGCGFYRISTMKGQFIFIVETEEEGIYKVSLKFIKQKMLKTQADIGKISQTQLETVITKGNFGVVSAMRVQPSQGGTTGPVSITFTKV